MTEKKYGMVIDLDKCSGCQACSVACKMENDVDLGVFRTRVYRMGPIGQWPDTHELFYFPNGCMNCEHPGARVAGDMNDPDSRISKVLAENADRVYRVHPEFGNEPKVVYLVPRKGAETLCKSIGLS